MKLSKKYLNKLIQESIFSYFSKPKQAKATFGDPDETPIERRTQYGDKEFQDARKSTGRSDAYTKQLDKATKEFMKRNMGYMYEIIDKLNQRLVITNAHLKSFDNVKGPIKTGDVDQYIKGAPRSREFYNYKVQVRVEYKGKFIINSFKQPVNVINHFGIVDSHNKDVIDEAVSQIRRAVEYTYRDKEYDTALQKLKEAVVNFQENTATLNDQAFNITMKVIKMVPEWKKEYFDGNVFNPEGKTGYAARIEGFKGYPVADFLKTLK